MPTDKDSYVPGSLMFVFEHPPLPPQETWADYHQALQRLTEETLVAIFQDREIWVWMKENLGEIGSILDLNPDTAAIVGNAVSKLADPDQFYHFSVKAVTPIFRPSDGEGLTHNNWTRSLAILRIQSDGELVVRETLENISILTKIVLTRISGPQNIGSFPSLPSPSGTNLLSITFTDASGESRVISPSLSTMPDPILPIGEGGPGGAPVAYIPPSDVNQIPYRFSLPGAVLGGEGDGVEVFILDTAPSEAVIKQASTNWGGSNPLLKWLADELQKTDENALFKIIYLQLEAGTDPILAKYPLNDHGLFIAGLVHSIAPKAKIRLIQVLNEYGQGTVTDIINGWNRVTAKMDSNSAKYVINCSFHYSPTTPVEQAAVDSIGIQMYPFLHRDFAPWDGQPKMIARTVAVAAPGNDSLHAVQRLDAKYPAANFPIFGAAALEHNSTNFTPYTNIAERSTATHKGFAVFGGNVISVAASSGGDQQFRIDPNKGILGLYISDFLEDTNESDNPNDWKFETNNHGWARWAGTSFSTAVMTGIMALLASKYGFGTDSDAKLPYQKVIEELTTAVDSIASTGEQLILVNQNRNTKNNLVPGA